MQKKRNIQIVVKIALLLLLPALHHAQIVIGSGPADGSAQLELQSTDKGMLIPRLTTAQRDAIVSPAMGLMIYNTSTHCLEINVGTASSPEWGMMNCRTGVIAALNCGSAVVTGTLSSGQAASGVSASVPYTGGNEGIHTGQTVTSTGVTGLTATLVAGSFANGAGNLTYNITGTPASVGTASFALNIGGQSCTLGIPVVVIGTVSTLNCAGASVTGTLTSGKTASGVSASVPYTGGNEGVHTGQTVTSTGVTGLTATLAAGSFANGAGNLTYNITGTPASGGTASFALNIGGQSCTLGIPVVVDIGTVSTLNCAGASVTGTLSSGQAASGVSASVPYTGGNEGVHTGQTVTSTGVTGLTATLAAGSFANGAGNLTYNITGTPASAGTASFALNIGGQSCTLGIPVVVDIGTVSTLNCAGASVTGTLSSGQAASGVSASVPYTGGNEGVHTGQTVTSTGVTGLTATLSAGSFANGAGNLIYNITGTPASAGTASFALNIGGQTCNLNVTVPYVCKAKIDPTTYRDFMCYNLGAANTSADPFTPGWEINGGYWQWGRAAQAAAGPTGPGAGQANDGAITGWNTTDAANGSWADGSKTGNDPCPSGFRVPTKAQWDGVLANNTQTNVGTFSNSATNYSAGIKFGDNLMLPAAGFRDSGNGTLGGRGDFGAYWSSTAYGTVFAWYLGFDIGGALTIYDSRTYGHSVRCIAELQGTLGALNCGSAVVTGTLSSGQAASGVSASVPYTGGNGGVHTGQTVTSTGVTGLTATLVAGSFASGAGNLTYNITGTPASVGTASFALNIGGQSCTLGIPVVPIGTVSTLNCAGATVTGTLNFEEPASGVSASVPYTGGNSGVHTGQTVTSTGVTGLTATLAAGSFASGAGNLTYIITGTPASGGTATFALNIGGQTCSLNVTVTAFPVCRAKISATVTKRFMCYNLGAANTSADPFTPGWEINGGYWQWGRLNQAAAGPSGPGAGQANGGAISGWNTTDAASGSWADGSKTVNDPCPSGFRVPTKAQWDGVLANNTITNMGTNWTAGATNYSTGKKFGDKLMLPAAGFRGSDDGTLAGRGNLGFYWSSTESSAEFSRYLYFDNVGVYYSGNGFRTYGLSVRCIAE